MADETRFVLMSTYREPAAAICSNVAVFAFTAQFLLACSTSDDASRMDETADSSSTTELHTGSVPEGSNVGVCGVDLPFAIGDMASYEYNAVGESTELTDLVVSGESAGWQQYAILRENQSFTILYPAECRNYSPEESQGSSNLFNNFMGDRLLGEILRRSTQVPQDIVADYDVSVAGPSRCEDSSSHVLNSGVSVQAQSCERAYVGSFAEESIDITVFYKLTNFGVADRRWLVYKSIQIAGGAELFSISLQAVSVTGKYGAFSG